MPGEVADAQLAKVHPLHWRLQALASFDLLSSSHRLAQMTVEDAIEHFMIQSLTTSALLIETNFDIELNTILTQFTQVDQPFTGPMNK